MSLYAALLALAVARPPALPPPAQEVDIDEHLGAPLPLELRFTDAHGRDVALREVFADGKPVVAVLAYLRCTMLCDLVLHGVVDGLAASGWTVGRDYRALTVSIDPTDTPPQLALRQHSLLQALGQPDAGDAWRFFVSDARTTRRLADRLGFQYAYDPRSNQYAHPAVAFVLTPDGRISRYLYGVKFRPLDLKLALTEASRGKVGGIVERVLLTCFRWDPSARRYALVVNGVMRGGAALVLLLVAGGVAWLIRLERRRS